MITIDELRTKFPHLYAALVDILQDTEIQYYIMS